MSEAETYRAVVYHRTLPAKVVTGRDAYEAALASGWSETPATFAPPAEPIDPELALAQAHRAAEPSPLVHGRDKPKRHARVVNE